MLPIAVIGGGPAGSTCALELARRGHNVVLFERRVRRAPSAIETCTPQVRTFIEATYGATIPNQIALPLYGIWSAWGSGDLDKHDYPFQHVGPGAVFDRSSFDDWLLNLAEKAGVKVRRGCRVIRGKWNCDEWALTVNHDTVDEHVRACFIVEASGAVSRSPAQPSAKRLFVDKLVGLSVELPSAARGDFEVAVESISEGWWFTAEAGFGKRLITLFTDADSALLQGDLHKTFRAELRKTRHVSKLADADIPTLEIKTTSARTSIRRLLWQDCWLPIGDAARTIDPLSGGGVGRALRDGIAGADVISRAIQYSDRGPLRSHALECARHFEQQLSLRRGYYEQEQRWIARDFWARRANGLLRQRWPS